MAADAETFTLKVERRSTATSIEVAHMRIDGTAEFIAQEVDVLLADPLLVSFSLVRASRSASTARQISS